MRGRSTNNALTAVIMAALLVTLAPSVYAVSDVSSGLAMSGFFESSEVSGDSKTLAYSPDGELIAAGYSNGVYMFNSTTKEVVKSLNLNDAVFSLDFSDDGGYLAVGMQSLESHQKAILLLSKEVDWNVIADEVGSKRVDTIQISPNNDFIVYNGPTTNLLEVNTSNIADSTSYDGIHSEKVNCISYSADGSHILSGGQDGRLVEWDRADSTGQVLYNFESLGILDCSVSVLGKIAVISEGGTLQVYSNSSQLEFSSELAEVSELEWSDDGLRLFVVQTIGGTKILSYTKTSDSWEESTVTLIGHQITDFDVKSDLSTLVISTNTRHIVEYSESFQPLYYGFPGLDTDSDGVPNDYDEDDDGDGVIDKWDTICKEGVSCPLTADESLIRNLKIVISESEISLFDIVLLTAEQSSTLRNLTLGSIEDDIFLSDQEAYRVSNSMCANLIDDDLIDAWKSRLFVEGASLFDGSVECSATHGLLGHSATDYDTRIRITTFTTFTLSEEPRLPYNITISGNVPMPSGSASQIAPLFPILVTIDAEHSEEYDVFWSTFDTGMTFYVEEAAPEEKTALEKAVEYILNNVIWTALLGVMMSLLLIYAIRRRNVIDLGVMDEELEEDVEDMEAQFWKADEGVSPPKPSMRPPNSRRQRVAKASKKVVARRIATGVSPTDSKRTRLDEHKIGEDAPDEWDYGWDATYDDTSEAYEYKEVAEPKVRKVKVADADKKSDGKRRKVKRRGKKKGKKASKKEAANEEDLMASALGKLISSNDDD